MDDWIAGLVTPQELARAQDDPDESSARSEALRARLAEVDRKIGSSVEAIETGASIPEIADQLQRRSTEKAGLEAQSAS